MIRKYLPGSLTRAVGRTGLKLEANAPKLLFVGGVAGVLTATALACRATLKVESIFVQHEKTMLDIKTVQHETYTEKDRQHDKLYLYVRTVTQITRLYGPSIIIMGASVAMLTKSHNLLQARNASLSAAYAGLDAMFSQYRENVRKEIGDEKEAEIFRESQYEIIPDGKGGYHKVKLTHGSDYTELYSADTNHNFHVGSHEDNIMKLRQRENYANDMLRLRGHLFLNEVLRELGFEHTEAGATVGWLFKPDDPNHDGDSYVSFGCWTDRDRDQIDPNMMNNDGGIFLEFNVDGEIHRRLREVPPVWKLTDKALRRKRGV